MLINGWYYKTCCKAYNCTDKTQGAEKAVNTNTGFPLVIVSHISLNIREIDILQGVDKAVYVENYADEPEIIVARDKK